PSPGILFGCGEGSGKHNRAHAPLLRSRRGAWAGTADPLGRPGRGLCRRSGTVSRPAATPGIRRSAPCWGSSDDAHVYVGVHVDVHVDVYGDAHVDVHVDVYVDVYVIRAVGPSSGVRNTWGRSAPAGRPAPSPAGRSRRNASRWAV